MTVYNYRLPTRIEKKVLAPAQGGPEFETRIFTSASGMEQRQGERSRAVGKWTLSLGLLDEDAFNELERLFYVLNGRLHGFLLKAPGDYESPNTVTIDGNPYKPYTITDLDGATHTYYRPITRTIAGSISGSYRQYLTPVRFDMDLWPFRRDTLWNATGENITFVEILEDFA